MSRPKVKPARVRQGCLVQTRLAPVDFQAVERLARGDGRSVAAWLRLLVEREIRLIDSAIVRAIR